MSTAFAKSSSSVLALLFVCVFPTGARAQPTRPDDAVDAYVRDEMERRRIPGLSLAVIRDGRVATTRGYGFADLRTRAPAGPATVYQIASITKVFAGAAVMALVEDGRLALSDSLTRLLDGLPPAWRGVTVWHCLTHTTGLPDVAVDATGRFVPATADGAIRSVAERPVVRGPGDTAVYQITGYLLLGRVVERLTGLSVDEYLRRRFFAPLALTATRYATHGTRLANQATLYRPRAGSAGRLPEGVEATEFPLQSYDHMVRGLFSTVEDLAKWDLALTAGRVLSKASLEQMWTPARLNDGARGAPFGDPSIGYGGGWMTYDLAAGRAVGHIGGNMGQYLRFLDRDLSVIVLTNAMAADARSLAEGVARLYADSSARRPAGDRPGPPRRGSATAMKPS
jgi:CubicO group peptidase (beta-lactamase class C family)